MTSYTLGNWDGGQSNSRDTDSKQHQTSKTSYGKLLPPANAQSAENTAQDAQGTLHDASRMDTTYGARDVASLIGDDGSGAVRNEVRGMGRVDKTPLTAQGLFDSHVTAIPYNASGVQATSKFYQPTQSYVIPPLSNGGATYAEPTQTNGTTYTGPTQTYVAPSNSELNAMNYAGPTQPYVIPPLQEPLPASLTRAATTNGYASGPQPAQSKAREQHTPHSEPPFNFSSWPTPLPQSSTPVPTKVLSNGKYRHSKQADSNQGATNKINPANPAPSQTRPRANTGRKTLEQHRRDAMKRDGVYSAPAPQAFALPNTSVSPFAADLANAINSLSGTNSNHPERRNVQQTKPYVPHGVTRPKEQQARHASTSTSTWAAPQSNPNHQHYRGERPGMQAVSRVQVPEKKQKRKGDKEHSKNPDNDVATAQSDVPSGSTDIAPSAYSKQAFDISSVYVPRPTAIPAPPKAGSEAVIANGGTDAGQITLPPVQLTPHPTTSRTAMETSEQYRSDSPLFTPPPDNRRLSPSQAIPSVDRLFTPTPPPEAPSCPSIHLPAVETIEIRNIQPKKRVWMSHVRVPHLPKGVRKADYKPLFKENVKQKRSRVDVQVHRSLEHALNTSLDHNANSGVIPELGLGRTQSSKPRTDKHKNIEHVGRRDVAGSSKMHVAGAKRKHTSEQDLHHRKHEVAADERRDVDVRPKKKFKPTGWKSTSDLSEVGSGADVVHVGTTIERIGRYGYTKYNAEEDVVRMLWDRVKVVPAPVLAMNIRHLGERVGVDRATITGKPGRKSKSKGEKGGQGDKWFVWHMPRNPVYEVGDSGELVELDGGISVGRSVRMEDWSDEEEVLEDKDSDSLAPKVNGVGHLQKKEKGKELFDNRARNRHGTRLPSITCAEQPGPQSQHTLPLNPIKALAQRSEAGPQRGPGRSSTVPAGGLTESGVEEKAVKPSAKALGKRKAVSPSSPRKKPPARNFSLTKHLTTLTLTQQDLQPADPPQIPSDWVSPSVAFPPSPAPRFHSQQRSPTSNRRASDPMRLSTPKERLVPSKKGTSTTPASGPSDPTANVHLHPYMNGFGAMQAPTLGMQSPEGRSIPSWTKFTFTAYSDPKAQNALLSSFTHDAPEDSFTMFGLPSTLLPIVDPSHHDESPLLNNSTHNSPFDHLDLPSNEMQRDESAVPWASLMLEKQYEFDTIDPTLLQGEEAATLHEELDVKMEAEGPPSPCSDAAAFEELEPSTHSSDSGSDFQGDNSASSARVEGSRTKRIQRHQPNLGNSGNLPCSQPGTSALSRPVVNLSAMKMPNLRPAPRGFQWERVSTEAYCHQCRTKTFRRRMKCTCKKEFCNRCISSRYPEIIFTSQFEAQCPYCSKFCNCDLCCVKRGDTYVKTPAPEASLSTATAKHPRIHLGGKTNLPPLASARVKKPSEADVPKLPRATHTITGPVEYWGAVYSLSGEKVATGFIGAHGDESVVFARELPLSQPVRKREFVGAIQRSWGLGRKPVVTDLHPASPDKKASRGKERRLYIGDGSRLPPRRKPSIRDDDLPSSFDFGTPTSTLTSVSDTEQQENEIDEELNQFSPECLCDDDMTRALVLGLHAVGVLAVVGEPSQPTNPPVPPTLSMSHPVYVSNSGGASLQLASAFSTLSIPDGSENLLQSKTTDQAEELPSLGMPSIVPLTGAAIQQDQAIIVQGSPTLGHQSRSIDAPLPLANCNAPPSSMHSDLPSPQFGTLLPPTDSAPLPAEFGAPLPSVDLGVPAPAELDTSPPSARSLPCGTPLSEEPASLSLLPQRLSKGTITTDVASTLASFNLDCPITMPLRPPQLTERPATTSNPQEPTPSLSASPKTTSLDGSLNPSMQHEGSTMWALSFLDSSSNKGNACDKDTVTSRPSGSIPLPNFTPYGGI